MALAVGVLLAAAVLLAVGLVAAGRIDGMYRAVPDTPPGLPEGPVTPEGLRRVKLPVVLRGYRMADVDVLLERVAVELAPSPEPAQEQPIADARPPEQPHDREPSESLDG